MFTLATFIHVGMVQRLALAHTLFVNNLHFKLEWWMRHLLTVYLSLEYFFIVFNF